MWFAVGYSTGVVSMIDARTGMLMASWKAHEGEILQVCVDFGNKQNKVAGWPLVHCTLHIYYLNIRDFMNAKFSCMCVLEST